MKRSIILILAVFNLFMLSSSAMAYSIIDWFLDKTPPVAASDIDSVKPYHGKAVMRIFVADQDTAIDRVRLILDGKDITSQARMGVGYFTNFLDLNTKDIKDGKHTLIIYAVDKAKDANDSETVVKFSTDNTAPWLKYSGQKSKLFYGKTAVIFFKGSETGLDIEGSFQGNTVKCYPMNGNYYSLILGAELASAPNNVYKLRMSVKDKADNISYSESKIKVYASSYPTVSFYLRPKKAKLLSPDIIRADWDRMEEVLTVNRDEKYWSGKFIIPTKGPVSLYFGTQEYINGAKSGRHYGLDIANQKGTTIRAANYGEVVLAEYIPAHGNTVVIDHGRGVFTYYAHLSRILVQVGQKVIKGQSIGRMGSTGISTAPHLHFAMSVHNARVDPLQWINSLVAE